MITEQLCSGGLFLIMFVSSWIIAFIVRQDSYCDSAVTGCKILGKPYLGHIILPAVCYLDAVRKFAKWFS